MNIAYVSISSITTGDSNIDSQPAGVYITYTILEPDGTVVESPENPVAGGNFSYGASLTDIQSSITGYLRSHLSDSTLSVLFIPKGV